MAVERRAKQFAPFAALKGFEDAVREKEIIYEPRRILSEERKNELDMKLRMLKPGMEIQVEYFTGNPLLPGFGRYHTVKGDVAFFDPSVGLRVGDTKIEIRDISFSIACTLFITVVLVIVCPFVWTESAAC